jgi:hypothetical protein
MLTPKQQRTCPKIHNIAKHKIDNLPADKKLIVIKG